MGQDGDEAELAAVRNVHGEAGPWVVAGYRMGKYALERLKLPRGSDQLEVIHHTPHEVQFASIADGAAAATGASLGKLNLTLQEDAEAADTRTTYRNKSGGSAVTLQTTPEFSGRYASVPKGQLAAAAKDVLHLPDAVVFRDVSATNPTK